ncbi:hypothetical protein [Myxococcus xanthus]|uniref:hypothetical protein n=1 Tax=Myxococcus xanthus TaxID=34 RepID=UPI00112AEE00|nr:hypothetical protein [Myxococcus xanthus]QDF06009.1 hypothetical protein BHS04_22775 [Myxococcus xanthus]
MAPKSLTREATKKIDQYLKEVAASLIETEQDVFTVKVDGEFERVSTKLEEAITQATLKPGVYLWYVEADPATLISVWDQRSKHYKKMTKGNKAPSPKQILTMKNERRAMKFSLSPLSEKPAPLRMRIEGKSKLLLYVGESGADDICGRLDGHRLGHPETGSLKLAGCGPIGGLTEAAQAAYDEFLARDRTLMNNASITSITCTYINLEAVARYRRRTYEGILREALLPLVGKQ